MFIIYSWATVHVEFMFETVEDCSIENYSSQVRCHPRWFLCHHLAYHTRLFFSRFLSFTCSDEWS